MIHRSKRKALELCLQNLKTDDPGRLALARAFAPILQEISSRLVGLRMNEQEAKDLVVHSFDYLGPLVEYLFDNFVREIALPDEEGMLRLLDSYVYDRFFH
jgi:hypothetical protein